MKGNLSSAAQLGLWEELFKGSCPSPHTAGGLHNQHYVGSFLGQNHLGTGSSSKAGTRRRKGQVLNVSRAEITSHFSAKIPTCYWFHLLNYENLLFFLSCMIVIWIFGYWPDSWAKQGTFLTIYWHMLDKINYFTSFTSTSFYYLRV